MPPTQQPEFAFIAEVKTIPQPDGSVRAVAMRPRLAGKIGVTKAAALLGLSPRSVRRLAQDGVLRKIQMREGGKVLLDEKEVVDWALFRGGEAGEPAEIADVS